MKNLFSRIAAKLGQIRWRLGNTVQTELLRRADLRWRLDSGVEIRVASQTDWGIYNDIFVEKEYDRALEETLRAAAQSGVSPRLLDLGSNVGYFLLRAMHLHRKVAGETTLATVGIEGSPKNFRELQARVGPQSPQARLYHGLVGSRSGAGTIWEHPFHGMTQVAPKALGTPRQVEFVDLMAVIRDWAAVDLLKCDIEGSEETVLRNYPDLLVKTNRLIIEFHSALVDVPACRELIRAAGLTRHEVLAERPYCSIEYFQRPSGDGKPAA